MAYCSNCRETITAVKKIAIGESRNVVFCGSCNCYVNIEEPQTKATIPAPSDVKSK